MLAMIIPVEGGAGSPSHPIHYPPGVWPHPPGGAVAPPIVIPPVGAMPPIYIPPAGVAPPIYYPPRVGPKPPGGGGRPTPPIYEPPVVWPGPAPAPPDPPDTVEPPIVIPPNVWPPLPPDIETGRLWVLAWIQGAGWHWLYCDLSQPKG
jgi:hypothetical protein